MKEGVTITTPNLTTNYISNVGFFKKYKGKIFGLTGTIGSEQTQTLLQNVYMVDCVFMPTYKERKLKEVKGIVTYN